METWLLYLIVPLILTLWAQARVTGAFKKYSLIRDSSGLTGAQAAREIMDAAQIHDVDIVQINGMLGDHYDPTQKRLCLSTQTYNSASIAAVGVAAHETGHAIQHARAYAPLQWRMTIVPVTQFADDNKLTIRQRLELFTPICNAIAHAHTKALIHRDIKASNVLPTPPMASQWSRSSTSASPKP